MLRYRRLFETHEIEEVEVGSKDLDTRAFVDLLDSSKAILIRKETPMTVNNFGDFVSKQLSLEKYPYIGGAAPRKVILSDSLGDAIVFTANESPPSEPIPFHHGVCGYLV